MTPPTQSGQNPTTRASGRRASGSGPQHRRARADADRPSAARQPAPDGAALAGADLSGGVFADESLAGADLRYADLSGADLRRADLTGALVDCATLAGADLRDAVFSGACLYGADLTGADLGGADLTDADLRAATIDDASLRDADLRGAALQGATLRGSNVVGTEFAGADVRDVGYGDLEARREDVIGLIAAALSTPHAPTRADGINAAAAFADADPHRCRALVPELRDALDAVALPSARITAVRTLASIWMATGAVTRADDRHCAQLLRRDGVAPVVRSVTVRDLAAVVVTYPHQFPDTVSAFVELLSDGVPEIRQTAMQTLAIVSYAAPEVTRELPALEREFETLRQFPDVPDADVDRAIEMLRGSPPQSEVSAH